MPAAILQAAAIPAALSYILYTECGALSRNLWFDAASHAEGGRVGQVAGLLQDASPPGSLRWARGREGCFDSPLSPSGHPSPLDGLWLPAYATALEWALHPAGHGPNNSSLFLPQAAVVVVARKGLLAPFRPQRGRLQPKIRKIHAIRREDLFTVFSASADLKRPSVAARQLPAGERVP